MLECIMTKGEIVCPGYADIQIPAQVSSDRRHVTRTRRPKAPLALRCDEVDLAGRVDIGCELGARGEERERQG